MLWYQQTVAGGLQQRALRQERRGLSGKPRGKKAASRGGLAANVVESQIQSYRERTREEYVCEERAS
eukprot:360946-Chlamydomonas_euryale.AAC.17